MNESEDVTIRNTCEGSNIVEAGVGIYGNRHNRVRELEVDSRGDKIPS